MIRKLPGPRFLLWVDAVGGYLVCLGEEVVLGQAVPHTGIEVPILADLSRRHAKLRREGEGYLIEPFNRVKVNGELIRTATLLSNRAEIELGAGVRLRFRQPHALSASARLDFVSRHHTQPSVDAVLLMAGSCVLGPGGHNHIVCRDWSGDVVLSRQGGDLFCRAAESIEIDGKTCEGRGRITCNSRVTGSDFAMSLEET